MPYEKVMKAISNLIGAMEGSFHHIHFHSVSRVSNAVFGYSYCNDTTNQTQIKALFSTAESACWASVSSAAGQVWSLQHLSYCECDCSFQCKPRGYALEHTPMQTKRICSGTHVTQNDISSLLPSTHFTTFLLRIIKQDLVLCWYILVNDCWSSVTASENLWWFDTGTTTINHFLSAASCMHI